MSADASDAELARAVALEAGALLLDLWRTEDCSTGELGKRGDARANELILARLRAARPQDFLLSEEAADDRARCAARRVWIIDPLDGTREYCDRRDDWAVHIGLAVNGVPVAGAVALPALGKMFASNDPPRVVPPEPPRPRMVISRSRPPAIALRVAQVIGADLVPMGSAGAKAMAVLDGRAEIYLHAGGQYQWDNCAPVAVAIAAGLHASRLDGAPMVYNCLDPLLPDVLICRKSQLTAVSDAIAAALGGGASRFGLATAGPRPGQ